MALPQLISEDRIKEIEEREEQKYHNMLLHYDQQKMQNEPAKLEWLAVFSRCLSPGISCRNTGVSETQYRKWRATDAAFCRGINHAIAAAQDELRSSILVRATGYLHNDPDTGQIERDAVGKPIYHGGSDVLAKALHMQDHNLEGKTAPVSITINTGSFYDDPAQVVVEQGGEVLEHDPEGS